MSTDSIVVAFRSGVTFSGLDSAVCIYNSPMPLTPGIVGGTFSGPGLLGTTFFPGNAGVGTHEIVYAVNDAGCLLTDTQTVVVDQCAGIQEPWTASLQVVPNPSNGIFNISVYSFSARQIEINIADIAGRLISKRSTGLVQGNNVVQFDLNVNSGIYLMQISDGSQKQITKLVVN
jgi:hypothetical protein